MRELINNVINWAQDRNILNGSTPIKQLDKTSEEFNELQRAAGALPYRQEYHIDLGEGLQPAYEPLVDAYGDVLVTLIISAKMYGIDLEQALSHAWEQIKDRKGKMIAGRFVKEDDIVFS